MVGHGYHWQVFHTFVGNLERNFSQVLPGESEERRVDTIWGLAVEDNNKGKSEPPTNKHNGVMVCFLMTSWELELSNDIKGDSWPPTSNNK